MATYPNLPYNRIIVGGIDISMKFQMALLDGYTLSPPEPKTYTVDIPGGNGIIDLTEAFAGDVVYNQRKQSFTFALIDMKTERTFEEAKTQVSNFLHGRKYEYRLTWDPDYTYTGRFSVSEYTHDAYPSGILGYIKIDVEADPYKSKGLKTYNVNAIGGRMFRLESGRKPVHPKIDTSQACTIVFDGKQTVVPAGSYILNDVLFHDGFNDFYINSFHIFTATWSELDKGGDLAMTWAEAGRYRWDALHLIKGDLDGIPISWEGIATKRWSDLATKTWKDLDLKSDSGLASDVYLQYEWGDL